MGLFWDIIDSNTILDPSRENLWKRLFLWIDAEQVFFELYQIKHISAKIDLITFLLSSSTSVMIFIQKCEILASTAGMCQRDDEIECGICLILCVIVTDICHIIECVCFIIQARKCTCSVRVYPPVRFVIWSCFQFV